MGSCVIDPIQACIVNLIYEGVEMMVRRCDDRFDYATDIGFVDLSLSFKSPRDTVDENSIRKQRGKDCPYIPTTAEPTCKAISRFDEERGPLSRNPRCNRISRRT